MMEGQRRLVQTTRQTLGSLRTLFEGFQNRPIPTELRSLAEALEYIYSKSLDQLLRARLETFSREADARRIQIAHESLCNADSGLSHSIDGMRRMSAQDSSTKDHISQIDYGWEVFNYQSAKVINVAIVDEEERWKFHPFTNRSRTVIREVTSPNMDIGN
jgi:hypothetical protein